MKNIYIMRQMLASTMAFLILIWVFVKNQLVEKIIVSPFLICSMAIFFENLCLLLNKEKGVTIFKYFELACLFIVLAF